MTRRSSLVRLRWLSLLSACRDRASRISGPRLRAPPEFKELAGSDEWKVATPSDDLPKGKWWEMFGDPAAQRARRADRHQQPERQAGGGASSGRRAPRPGESRQLLSRRSASNRRHPNRSAGRTPAAAPAAPASRLRCRWTRPGNRTLWGRVRLSVENATSNAQVSAADLENVRLSQQALLAIGLLLARRRRHAAGDSARHDRRLRKKPAAHDRPLQRRRGVEGRRHARADAAGGREGAEHGSAGRARAVRACHRDADRASALRRRRSPPAASPVRRRRFP